MKPQTKRFTLDLETSFQRRLKVMAALKGVSMRQYCLTAVERELERDSTSDAPSLPFGVEALDRLASLQSEVFDGKRVHGDSADLIRGMRESRSESL